jgi:hypothetical protein
VIEITPATADTTFEVLDEIELHILGLKTLIAVTADEAEGLINRLHFHPNDVDTMNAEANRILDLMHLVGRLLETYDAWDEQLRRQCSEQLRSASALAS